MNHMLRSTSLVAVALGSATVLALLSASPLQAQEPSQGVRIGLTYSAGTRPGLYVLPLRGANADSIRAIITRDTL